MMFSIAFSGMFRELRCDRRLNSAAHIVLIWLGKATT